MHRIPTTIAILALALSSVGSPGYLAAAQSVVIPLVPASAVIRGENIHLRLDPAEVTEVIALLQRGDAVTITGDPTAADGDTFYPVQTATGDTGWVRDLFIDPGSIVPLDAPPEVQVDVDIQPDPEPAPDIEIDVPEEPTRRERAQDDAAATEDAREEEPQNQRNPRNRNEPNQAEEPQAEAESDAQAVASVAGVGATSTETFLLEPGRYRVVAAMDVDDATGFIADLIGPDDFQENLFNETIEEPQAWTAETDIRIRDAGDYYIAVSDTELEWTIEITPA